MALTAAIAGCSTDSRSANPIENAVAPSGLALIPLTIRSGDKIHRFTVEYARTADEQATGLMFRTELPADGGMLFPFDPPKDASFWMMNTFIPLDMIFIDSSGTIVTIVTAQPESFDSIRSGLEVAAVLEIAGGRAEQLGIKVGDRVEWQR